MAETEGVRLTQAHIPRADCPSHRVHRDRRAMREGRSATFRRVDQGSPALLLKTRFRRQRIQRPNPRKRRSARALGNMRASRGASSTDQRMRTILRRHARAHIAYPRGILLNSSRTSRRPGKHPVTPKETPVKFELNRPLGYLPRDLAKRYRQRKNHAHAVSVTASAAPICLTSYDPVSYFSASGRHEDARVQRPATFKVPSKRRTNESERSTNRPAIDPNQQHRRYDRTFSRPLVAREVRRQHGFQGRTVSEAGGGLRRS
ncbi:hypothetical protein AWB73_00298 [Caballeronia turbans]|jgi:hypothetical protein|nr:hypothetical protein AWB73_00298 [Caballeronia turbans]